MIENKKNPMNVNDEEEIKNVSFFNVYVLVTITFSVRLGFMYVQEELNIEQSSISSFKKSLL